MIETLMVELPIELADSIVVENAVTYNDWLPVVEACKAALVMCRCGHEAGKHRRGGACESAACGCKTFRKKVVSW